MDNTVKNEKVNKKAISNKQVKIDNNYEMNEKAENSSKKSQGAKKYPNDFRKARQYKNSKTNKIKTKSIFGKKENSDKIEKTEKSKTVSNVQKPQRNQRTNSFEKDIPNTMNKTNEIHAVKNVRVSKDIKNIKSTKNSKVISDEYEVLDFVLGEFSENGKNFAFKMSNHKYFIVEIIDEQENIILTTSESKQAYSEWGKIKYPDKVKKGMF